MTDTDEASSFFDTLPAELRVKIYHYVLHGDQPRDRTVLDLDPTNHIRLAPVLTLLQVSHRMHNEVSHILYSSNTFAIFPQHGRFFYKAQPILARLPEQYLGLITSLSLTLGQGWSRIPRSWHNLPALGLPSCIALRKLQIMVRCDPSARFFDGFRGEGKDAGWYTRFSVQLLRQILGSAPWLVDVEIESFPGITKRSLLVAALTEVLVQHAKRVSWGPDISAEEDKTLAPIALSGRLDALVSEMNAMHLAAQAQA